MDHLSPEKRSRNMSLIRSKDTAPEWIVRRLIWSMGIRYRLHRKDLPGKPDLAISRLQTAVFVHGCYWHRHKGCSRASTPSTRADFWMNKFAENQARDARNVEELNKQGWRVLVVWECETRKKVRGRLKVRLSEALGTSPRSGNQQTD